MRGANRVLDLLADMQAEPLLARWAAGHLRQIAADPSGARAEQVRGMLGVFRGAAVSVLEQILRNPRYAPRAGRRHDLPGELIVSLTSYPPRYERLDLTLSSLLGQSVAPDRILLWLTPDDEALLPDRVRRLRGISIRSCDDLRSYKKLVPALDEASQAYIVTADDDVFYGRHWLESLVSAARPGQPLVTCRRAHRLKRSPDGRIAPYREWEIDVIDAAANQPSTDLVPIGIGGVLYPPGALDPLVLHRERFMRLCPNGDDLWFYWTARIAGTKHRQAGGKFWQLTWPSTQDDALWVANHDGGNDRMVKALEAEFGALPL